VCVLVGTTAALQGNAVQLTRAVFTGGGGLVVTFAVAPLLQAYFGVVSMRIVGLYYHHFKKRFAWSWE
jgi:hypothetical protein